MPKVVDISPAIMDANPYPVYRWLRQDAPVAVAPALYGYCLITRWKDVEAVLKDDERFSAQAEQPPDAPVNLRGSILFLDGEEHARLRSFMQPACQPRPVKDFAESIVAATADELIDGFEASRRADLVDRFFEPLATTAVAKLLGLEHPSTAEFRRLFRPIAHYFKGDVLPRETHTASEQIDQHVLANLRRLVREPNASVLSTMLRPRDGGRPLSETEILTNVKVFAAAGVHELRDLMAHTLLGLLSRPEQLDELSFDLSRAKAAIEEGARWASPVGMVPRVTASDVELAGVHIPAGTHLAVGIASANRDERRWSDPGRFDLHRDEGAHLAYASGVHFCLGAWLARAAGALALQRLVERLPDLRLDQNESLSVTGWRFRVVNDLHATW